MVRRKPICSVGKEFYIPQYYKYLKGRCKEDGARHFSVVARNRTRGNRHKHRKWPSKNEKQLLYFDRALEQATREVVESSSLKIFEYHLEAFLCNFL